MKYLKYAPSPRETASEAYKSDRLGATVRYADEKGIEEGDDIMMLTEDGVLFGIASVVVVNDVEVYSALSYISHVGAVYGHDGRHELLEALNSHYDGVLGMDTRVKVILYDVETLFPVEGVDAPKTFVAGEPQVPKWKYKLAQVVWSMTRENPFPQVAHIPGVKRAAKWAFNILVLSRDFHEVPSDATVEIRCGGSGGDSDD